MPCWIATDSSRREGSAIADALDLVDDRNGRIARAHEIRVQECTIRSISTVLCAAIRACAITNPPKTRCQPFCGLLPRKQIFFQLFQIEALDQIPHWLSLFSGCDIMHGSAYRHPFKPDLYRGLKVHKSKGMRHAGCGCRRRWLCRSFVAVSIKQAAPHFAVEVIEAARRMPGRRIPEPPPYSGGDEMLDVSAYGIA